ncbi:zinc finger MYND domain-containing protein 15 [Python bivittatus]|uniref:Zinc finger MYND domain-containing protein 15 n=1 Tax=Python bivittatus TaxID=176946 RepID=A0A9F5N568_PYTBI|nr:zinc finger MYND domain-containing protein 15 [Python bivittatus]
MHTSGKGVLGPLTEGSALTPALAGLGPLLGPPTLLGNSGALQASLRPVGQGPSGRPLCHLRGRTPSAGMEFVTGYRAEILDFAELLFGWYQRFLLDAACRRGSERRKRQEGSIRRLPPDPALWVLHVLPNRNLAFTVADPGQQVGGRLYSEEALALQDLDRFITFVGAGEEEEEEEEEDAAATETGQPLWRVEHLLLVTDEYGTILGFDFQLGGSLGMAGQEPLEPRAIALLCYSMFCPLGAGEPRRPKLLTVGDPALHKSLEPLLARLGVKMSKGPMRGWGPKPAFTFPTTRVRACHVCKRHSFEGQITACQHCRAVFYCSERCRKLDWSRSPEDIGHQFWCQRMAGYMSHARELANLPFTFASEATSENFNKEGFLVARGLTRGYWAGESMLVRAPDYGVGLQNSSAENPVPFLQSGNPFEALRPEGGTALPSAPPEPPAPRTFFGTASVGILAAPVSWPGLPQRAGGSKRRGIGPPGQIALRPGPQEPRVATGMGPEPSAVTGSVLGGSEQTVSAAMAGRGPWGRAESEGASAVLIWSSPAEELLAVLPGNDGSCSPGPSVLSPAHPAHPSQRLPGGREGGSRVQGLSVTTCGSPCTHRHRSGEPGGQTSHPALPHFSPPHPSPLQELSVLLPHVSLELLFVGDTLPPELDGQQFLLQRDEEHGVSVQPGLAPRSKGGRRELQLGFSARPYHLLQAPKPDLVIGFNSGFALKETWLSVLPRLQSLRVPAYFTECSAYSCAVDEATVSMATGGSASPAQINPFRSPFRQAGIDNAMPWYSNAFIFHLIYKAPANNHRQSTVPPPQSLLASGNPDPPEPARSRRKDKRQIRAAGRRRK